MSEKGLVLYKPNQLIAITNKNISLNARKAYNVILYQAQQELRQNENRNIFFFRLKDIKEKAGIRATDNWHLKRDIEDLIDIKIKEVTKTKRGEDWGIFVLISGAVKKGDLLRIELPYQIREALIKNKYYTEYDLLRLKRLYLKHAVVIYEFILRYKKVEIPDLTIEDFRKLAGIENLKTYKLFNEIKRKILEPAIKEINTKTDIDINYELKKQGRKVIAVKFFILKKQEKKSKQREIKKNIIEINIDYYKKSIKDEKFNIEQFIIKALKSKKHKQSIIDALEQIVKNQNRIQNLWAYGCKILNIQSGNYNYNDHVTDDKKRKAQEKKDSNISIQNNLLKQIQDQKKDKKPIEQQRKELFDKFGDGK